MEQENQNETIEQKKKRLQIQYDSLFYAIEHLPNERISPRLLQQMLDIKRELADLAKVQVM